MAPPRPGKGKKVVNQEELRRLMREKQRQTADKKKRIEAPFAKYPYRHLGHLRCVLCNTPVKSELLWQTHVLGSGHKEKVAELKAGVKPTASSDPVSQTPTASILKRKAPDTESLEVKKVKVPSSAAPSSLGLLTGAYDKDDDDEEQEEDANKEGGAPVVPKGAELPLPAASGLPGDFFDSSIPPVPIVSHSGSIPKPDEQEKPIEKKDNTAEALPEGFFDDPVRDAKVRKVDAPKDQMDKEWEEFQKEMRQVNNASEAIVAEDDEEGRLDRQIGEIDEQM
ncbi:ZN830 protein, partial [Amia calva]|nr:ZN830 protein [Amia calva]